jgi:hypothetical protein
MKIQNRVCTERSVLYLMKFLSKKDACVRVIVDFHLLWVPLHLISFPAAIAWIHKAKKQPEFQFCVQASNTLGAAILSQG